MAVVLFISAFAAVVALLTGIVKLGSHAGARSSQPVRLDPMDWHPGRFFPPALNRLKRENERPTGVGQTIDIVGRRIDSNQTSGTRADERRGSSGADSANVFRQIA